MPNAAIDGLVSATLKDLREHWWNDEFTNFLRETLRPRPGNRILDVGCGTGVAEVAIGRLHLSQIRLFGIDLHTDRVIEARKTTAAHNQRVGFAAADACRLPFVSASFDSTYCVAVLQHIRDVDAAIGEFARVTRPGGRVVAVEPDNAARYWHSSTPAGERAFDAGARFFAALTAAQGDRTDASIGPKLPTLFAAHGIEAIDVRLFPVAYARIGAPAEATWTARRARIERLMERAATDDVRAAGREYLSVLASYAQEATAAGPAFVEIQNTLLFATVGQRDPA